LLAKFGRPAPAVGFAVGLDRLHIAVSGQGGVSVARPLSLALVDGLESSLDLANELRDKGVTVFALPSGTSKEAACRMASENELSYVALPEGDSFRLLDLAGGNERTVTKEELTKELAG
jgi:histidyl-tRNA synthetase